jgi:hypothetical protein
MVKNESGQVAVAYYQTVPHVVTVNGVGIAFSVQWNVCLAWVDESLVPGLFSIHRSCCGQIGNGLSSYYYASDSQVSVWTNGHY